MSFFRDLKVAAFSLIRTPGMAVAVVLTLALGIGANAAIFTLVRGVLLKPLVNRDEDRLIYIRQSALASARKHLGARRVCLSRRKHAEVSLPGTDRTPELIQMPE